MQEHRAETVLGLYSSMDCERVLDVGCGDGAFASRIGAACGAAEVHGLDVSADRVAAAAERGVEAVVADVDAEGLPFPADHFDSIHAGESLDYFEEPGRFFEEARRCLAPDGALVVSTPNLASLHNRLALMAGRLPYPLRASADVLVPPEADRRLSRRRTLYTHGTLLETVRDRGFEVEAVYGSHSRAADRSRAVAAVESLLERYPRLCYRLVVVCRPGAERRVADRRIREAA